MTSTQTRLVNPHPQELTDNEKEQLLSPDLFPDVREIVTEDEAEMHLLSPDLFPDVSEIITEDDTPVDNWIQEKQQRFLVECLYSSLRLKIPFVAAADVGLFYGLKIPPLVPDVMLSLNVAISEDWGRKENRSYFIWEFGKPPEVAIEIVSNKKGKELGRKLRDYAYAGVAYYVVFDPLKQISDTILQVFGLMEGEYSLLEQPWMERVHLGLTLWEGKFEGSTFQWLRWQDGEGNLLLTGSEQAEQERSRAEQERSRADRLAELLRANGIEFED